MPKKVTGSCLCGAVRVRVNTPGELGVCHCETCRNWGGGPYISVECGKDVSFSDSGHIVSYPSSEWANRGFCKACGTHLYYKYLQTGDYFMPAGLFKDDEEFEITAQIFIDQQPHYYAFANDTPKLTGEQVIEQFSQSN